MNPWNILMALNHNAPLLIDFACHQCAGHTVQDFARLEVAIKFELMGREASQKATGKDLDCQQLESWCAADKVLAAWRSQAPVRAGIRPAWDAPTVRAFEHCVCIRQAAWRLHQELAPAIPEGDFRVSYHAALLYHTLRAVGYQTLPHVKRLLAVHSVGRLVRKLALLP